MITNINQSFYLLRRGLNAKNSKNKRIKNLLRSMVVRYFIFISVKEGKGEIIQNAEVIDEIKQEVERLKNE